MDVQMLLEACKSGDADVVERILSREPTLVQCSDTEGRLSTPLHFAAGYNRLDVCKLLVQKYKADVRACDRASLQPLHNAASYGHVKIAAFLIENGADVNAQVRKQKAFYFCCCCWIKIILTTLINFEKRIFTFIRRCTRRHSSTSRTWCDC